MIQLTEKQAYRAAQIFLEKWYDRGPTDEISIILSSMLLLSDGGSADPAMVHDWHESVEQALWEVREGITHHSGMMTLNK